MALLVDEVRNQTLFDASRVCIDESKLAQVARELAELGPPIWDEHAWHLDAKTVGLEGAIHFVFCLDALNFCFWPSRTGLEYEDLARAVCRAHFRGDLTVAKLCDVSADVMALWLEPGHEWPLPDLRVKALRELGQALKQHGPAIAWVKQAGSLACVLVELIAQRLPMFRDQVLLPHGDRRCFYKRAQILVADVWGACGRPGGDAAASAVGGFTDIASLTTFADYRVPQLLRDMQVLVYSPALCARVDAMEEIPAGSEDELAIRSATVVAVELVKRELHELHKPLTSVEVDWLLWQQGEKSRGALRPHHRTLTWFY
jgi:hypothetical protein